MGSDTSATPRQGRTQIGKCTSGTGNQLRKGTLAIAHNGNLVNAIELREERTGIYRSHYSRRPLTRKSLPIYRERAPECRPGRRRRKKCDEKDKGGVCPSSEQPEKDDRSRDPSGLKPLCIGKRDNTYFLASESCAIAAVDAEFVRDVLPGRS